MIKQGVTVKKWLERVADTDTSTEQESTMMQNLLRRVGFPKAVVVLGVVYVEGHGTMEFPPMSIHDMAEVLLEKGDELSYETAKE